MKLSLLAAVLLGLGAAAPSQAQRRASSPAPLSSLPRLTHADSVAVLHQLFRHERRGGREGALADAVVLPLNAVALDSGQRTDFQRGVQFATVAVFIPLLVNNVVRWAHYSKRREREAIEHFEQRLVQPLYLQRAYALALIERSNRP